MGCTNSKDWMAQMQAEGWEKPLDRPSDRISPYSSGTYLKVDPEIEAALIKGGLIPFEKDKGRLGAAKGSKGGLKEDTKGGVKEEIPDDNPNTQGTDKAVSKSEREIPAPVAKPGEPGDAETIDLWELMQGIDDEEAAKAAASEDMPVQRTAAMLLSARLGGLSQVEPVISQILAKKEPKVSPEPLGNQAIAPLADKTNAGLNKEGKAGPASRGGSGGRFEIVAAPGSKLAVANVTEKKVNEKAVEKKQEKKAVPVVEEQPQQDEAKPAKEQPVESNKQVLETRQQGSKEHAKPALVQADENVATPQKRPTLQKSRTTAFGKPKFSAHDKPVPALEKSKSMIPAKSTPKSTLVLETPEKPEPVQFAESANEQLAEVRENPGSPSGLDDPEPVFDPELVAFFERTLELCSEEDWEAVKSTVSDSEESLFTPTPTKPAQRSLFQDGISPVKPLDFRKHATQSSAEKSSAIKSPARSADKTKSPPRGAERVVIYTTTLRTIRKTYEDCNYVRSLFETFGVAIDERDISIHLDFRHELRKLMGGPVTVPRVFVRGNCVGGIDEIKQLNEDGELEDLLQDLPRSKIGRACSGCGGMRFLPCGTCDGSRKLAVPAEFEVDDDVAVVRCPDCNENGLQLCRVCA